MIRVEVIETFSLYERFNELKDIVRAGKEERGMLFVGDKFLCEKELADYLLGNNRLNRAFVKIIEVIPEEEPKKEVVEEKVKRTRTSRKSIAKK